MAQESLIDLLERRVYQALKKIAEQQKVIHTLIREKQELEKAIDEKERLIRQLQKQIEELSQNKDAELLKEFQAREMKLKERLQELVEKIDKVRLLE